MKDKPSFLTKMNQKGVIYPLTLLLLAVMGLLIFLLVTTFFPFKSSLFSTIYPKTTSQAASNPDPKVPAAPQAVTITNPPNNSVLETSSEVMINFSVTDNIGVVKVDITINGELFCSVDSPPYECSWRVPSLKDTSYIIKAQAYDKEGNISSSEVIVKSR
ncbi:MAG: Fibronectin type III domain protein [Candidatus Daviesbacteria bacterium GW2011_GWA1_41_61]|uniref:Fibronectin type III domain protein n=1 Tax=Candidatus Daviesbacteria bacterium GW2011_GWA2_40_9 TaxID=1618424 RepID=A0A0G0TZN3_9BACT|nr:MAG: Fibronectin type III domain protein [Candidatus Daviesbacteria bacterium GW2011_GWC1_40_9]KKR82298.1 MAG: Fibronectin type III domain protein [Candidatus Daviesbacteria bacterium GW2011_GWA2_40_9]KKR93049.1 MAG: Fibronectin type III domain protein [Candidatus Daviesbacteria bacterium GW2011_GWB1_41_15]KKS15593.1 MAG: Fibronectin type III domain protein [Candidatus Daviesbacteria bacterium GW2011_GWA1_41_61]